MSYIKTSLTEDQPGISKAGRNIITIDGTVDMNGIFPEEYFHSFIHLYFLLIHFISHLVVSLFIVGVSFAMSYILCLDLFTSQKPVGCLSFTFLTGAFYIVFSFYQRSDSVTTLHASLNTHTALIRRDNYS